MRFKFSFPRFFSANPLLSAKESPLSVRELADLAANQTLDVGVRVKAVGQIDDHYRAAPPTGTDEDRAIGTRLYFLGFEKKHPEAVREAASLTQRTTMRGLREGWTHGPA